MTTRPKSGISSGGSRRRRHSERECELKLQDAVRLAYASSPNVRLFRNNNGVLQDRNGCYVAYGLGPGTSDLIGWRTCIPTCPSCGYLLDPIAQFVALEVKRPGEEPNDQQGRFLECVEAAGGIGVWADSVELALRLIRP